MVGEPQEPKGKKIFIFDPQAKIILKKVVIPSTSYKRVIKQG